jgi:hypothetical protein
MIEERLVSVERSYVSFERTARGVIVPKVKVIAGDHDRQTLDIILDHSKQIFREALDFAEQEGEKP